MTYFQRKRIKQITEQIERRDSLINKDADELLERFLVSRWTAAISIAILLVSMVFALTALWRILAS